MKSMWIRRSVGVAMLAAAACAQGCMREAMADPGWGDWSWGEGSVAKETRTILVDHVAGKPLAVKSENGSITVAPSTDKGVSITARVRARDEARLKATQILTSRLEDGTLDIRVQWPDNERKNNEGVAIEVAIPDARNVTLQTSNGGVSVSGMSGAAVLGASNGGVSVVNHDGSVEATTSNGGVSIKNVNGQVSVKTSNGPVNASGVLGPASIKSSNGPVELALKSESTGPVDCRTSNGPVRLHVGSAFAGTLSASTSNAGVSVQGVDSARVDKKKKSATVRFTDAGPESTLQTSNGPVVVVRD